MTRDLRRLVASVHAFVFCCSGVAFAVPAAHAAPQGNWTRVLTHVAATLMVTSTQRGRLVEAGPADQSRDATAFYAVVDTTRLSVVARVATGGTVAAIALDERAGRAYLVGSMTPPQGSAQSYLWTVDLTSGRLLARRPFAEGGVGAIASAVVDPRTGFVILALGQAPSCCTTPGWGAVVLLDPRSLWMRRQPVPALPTWLAVESGTRRVVVAMTLPPSTERGQPSTAIEGMDTAQGDVAWTRTFAYPVVALADNPRTAEIWLLAPGGLVTRIGARAGVTTGVLPVAQRAGDPPHYASLLIDQARNVGYVSLINAATNGCEIDRADPRAGARWPMIYQGDRYAPCGTLVGVDPTTGLIVETQRTGVGVIDPSVSQTAVRVLGTATDQIPDQVVHLLVTPQGRASFAVFVSSVPDLNQETGSTTAAGLTFVPIL